MKKLLSLLLALIMCLGMCTSCNDEEANTSESSLESSVLTEAAMISEYFEFEKIYSSSNDSAEIK